eukprot:5651314-Alexandrium_andersonii.AAC.1
MATWILAQPSYPGLKGRPICKGISSGSPSASAKTPRPQGLQLGPSGAGQRLHSVQLWAAHCLPTWSTSTLGRSPAVCH